MKEYERAVIFRLGRLRSGGAKVKTALKLIPVMSNPLSLIRAANDPSVLLTVFRRLFSIVS